jgi:hypothetical protein
MQQFKIKMQTRQKIPTKNATKKPCGKKFKEL